MPAISSKSTPARISSTTTLTVKLAASLILSLLSSALAACASAESPTRSDQGLARTDVPYTLQTGDGIDVKLFYNDELNESLVIRPDGKISLQLIPEIQAAGLTPLELTESIVEYYTAILTRPQVAVIVTSFEGQKIYVGGEVTKPGVFTLTGKTTTLQAVFDAGGFTQTASPGSVILISKGAGNVPIARKINLNRVMAGLVSEEDTLLRPFDIVYVPMSTIGKLNKFVDQYIVKMLPVNLNAGFQYVTGSTSIFD